MVIRWHDELTMIMIWWWIKISFLFLLVMRVAVYYELIPCTSYIALVQHTLVQHNGATHWCNTLVQHIGSTLVQRLIARCPLNDLAAIRMIGDDASVLSFDPFSPTPLVSGSATSVWAGFWAFCQIWYPWTVIFKSHQNQLRDCFGRCLASLSGPTHWIEHPSSGTLLNLAMIMLGLSVSRGWLWKGLFFYCVYSF